MLAHRLIQFARLDRLERRPDVRDSAVALAFTARFVDEVLSGAWSVLTPTFRRVFGLSVVQIGLLSQVLDWVALVVEPVASSLIDLRSRRTLLSLGSSAVALSVLLMGAAPGYLALLAAFAIYGIGSGPLAHTADVVVIESFPTAPERAFGRATFLDTVGALIGPSVVALVGAAGVTWRAAPLGLGFATLLYAIATARTSFPAPSRTRDPQRPLVRELVSNAREVLRSPRARRMLLVLFCFDVFETAFVLKYVWLHDTVGLSEPLVATYAAAEQLVDLIALLLLDRWLSTHDGGRVLRVAAGVLVFLPAAWVIAPGIGGRLIVGIPLAFTHALVWPLAKARSLTAVPGLAGATQAITTLFPIVPLTLIEAWLAQAIGVGTAMAITAAVGACLMLLAESGRPR